jgi:hypothetical protein
MLTIVIQRFRGATDPCFVFLEQLKVPPSHGRIDNVLLAIRRYEEVLDHAVGTQQVETIQKQLGIRRNALTNGACQFDPLLAVAIVRGVFISGKERHETLNQQGEIKGIGSAGAQNQAALIERHARLR